MSTVLIIGLYWAMSILISVAILKIAFTADPELKSVIKNDDSFSTLCLLIITPLANLLISVLVLIVSVISNLEKTTLTKPSVQWFRKFLLGDDE